MAEIWLLGLIAALVLTLAGLCAWRGSAARHSLQASQTRQESLAWRLSSAEELLTGGPDSRVLLLAQGVSDGGGLADWALASVWGLGGALGVPDAEMAGQTLSEWVVPSHRPQVAAIPYRRRRDEGTLSLTLPLTLPLYHSRHLPGAHAVETIWYLRYQAPGRYIASVRLGGGR